MTQSTSSKGTDIVTGFTNQPTNRNNVHTKTKMDQLTLTYNHRTLIIDEESDFENECKIMK